MDLLRCQLFSFEESGYSFTDVSPLRVSSRHVKQKTRLTLRGQSTRVDVTRYIQRHPCIAKIHSGAHRVNLHVRRAEFRIKVISIFPETCSKGSCSIDVLMGLRSLPLTSIDHSQNQVHRPQQGELLWRAVGRFGAWSQYIDGRLCRLFGLLCVLLPKECMSHPEETRNNFERLAGQLRCLECSICCDPCCIRFALAYKACRCHLVGACP
ncbi:hypothetical protein [Streptomyces halobius]|uniref:Uncharacterized protein n=1 Tax=Streptomyces halobius TaxID=2879846 RepID=A0ABY4MP38_9ACTN|nr:hypothetical protein [Streptomyces halobius]UQA98201.1 hypothetical protein K9S39_31205 [Streptomyces halobius]